MPKQNSRQLRKLKNNPTLLTQLGYRRVSNSTCTVARVDKPDWQKEILEINPAILLGHDGGANHYRRALSEDKIKLEDSVYKLVPGSDGDPVGFINENGEDLRCTIALLEPDEIIVKAVPCSIAAPVEPKKPSFITWLLSLLK
ncbi:hypothetical protein VPHK120G1_0058 [Vibrio phage K120 g1]